MASGANDPQDQTQEPVQVQESNCHATPPSSSLANGAARAAADDGGGNGLSPSTNSLQTQEQSGDGRGSDTDGSSSACNAAPSFSFANEARRGAVADGGDDRLSLRSPYTSPLRTREESGYGRGSGTGGSSSASNAAPSSSFAKARRGAVADGGDGHRSLRKPCTSPLRTREQSGYGRCSGTGGSNSTSNAAPSSSFANRAPSSSSSSFASLAPPAAGFGMQKPLNTPLWIREQPGDGRSGTSRSSSAAASDLKGKNIAITSPPFSPSSPSSSGADTSSLPIKALKCHTLPCAEGASQPLIRPVWRHNFEEELHSVRSLLRNGRVKIALDMEFASAAQDQVCPRTTLQWYRNVYGLVNSGGIIQIGLAISVDSGSLPVHVIELNMQFDVNSRQYNEKTLKFLTDNEYDLAAHLADGIPAGLLSDWFLKEFDRFYDRQVTWIFFQGDFDTAFLLTLLGNSMPETLAEHLRRYTCSFPILYDARVLARMIFGKGARGLNSLGDALNVRRIGKEHSSGSDSLLTLDCFFELTRRLGDDRIHPWRGVLCGLFDVDSIVSESLPMGHCELEAVHVWVQNFDYEALLIEEVVQGNHYIAGLDVCLSPALRERMYHTDLQGCFEQMFHALRLFGHYEVSLCLLSYTGLFPKGKWWIFHLSEYANAPHHIHFSKFAVLLEECNLIRNERIIWATFEGADGIASLCRIVQRSSIQADIPFRVHEYIHCRHLIFPSLYDIGLLLPSENGSPLADMARRLGLHVPDEQSEWKAVLCAQIMVRLRECLEESDSLVQTYADGCGQLLAKCCSSLRLYR